MCTARYVCRPSRYVCTVVGSCSRFIDCVLRPTKTKQSDLALTPTFILWSFLLCFSGNSASGIRTHGGPLPFARQSSSPPSTQRQGYIRLVRRSATRGLRVAVVFFLSHGAFVHIDLCCMYGRCWHHAVVISTIYALSG